MVCTKCEKKLDKLATPDVWKGEKSKAERSTHLGKDEEEKRPSGAGNKLLEKERKLPGLMLPEKGKYKYTPYGSSCRICKKKVLERHNYCQSCSYIKGICSMCGKKIIDVKMYRQTLV